MTRLYPLPHGPTRSSANVHIPLRCYPYLHLVIGLIGEGYTPESSRQKLPVRGRTVAPNLYRCKQVIVPILSGADRSNTGTKGYKTVLLQDTHGRVSINLCEDAQVRQDKDTVNIDLRYTLRLKGVNEHHQGLRASRGV